MKYDTLFLLAVSTLALTGCSHTVSGVQQDAAQNAPLVQAAVQQASQSLKQASKSTDKDLSSGLSTIDRDTHLAILATRIKAHIIASKDLNNDQNQIIVKSTSQGIALTGHVVKPAYKAEAKSIALSVIAKDHESVALNNQLTVGPS